MARVLFLFSYFILFLTNFVGIKNTCSGEDSPPITHPPVPVALILNPSGQGIGSGVSLEVVSQTGDQQVESGILALLAHPHKCHDGAGVSIQWGGRTLYTTVSSSAITLHQALTFSVCFYSTDLGETLPRAVPPGPRPYKTSSKEARAWVLGGAFQASLREGRPILEVQDPREPTVVHPQPRDTGHPDWGKVPHVPSAPVLSGEGALLGFLVQVDKKAPSFLLWEEYQYGAKDGVAYIPYETLARWLKNVYKGLPASPQNASKHPYKPVGFVTTTPGTPLGHGHQCLPCGKQNLLHLYDEAMHHPAIGTVVGLAHDDTQLPGFYVLGLRDATELSGDLFWTFINKARRGGSVAPSQSPPIALVDQAPPFALFFVHMWPGFEDLVPAVLSPATQSYPGFGELDLVPGTFGLQGTQHDIVRVLSTPSGVWPIKGLVTPYPTGWPFYDPTTCQLVGFLKYDLSQVAPHIIPIGSSTQVDGKEFDLLNFLEKNGVKPTWATGI